MCTRNFLSAEDEFFDKSLKASSAALSNNWIPSNGRLSFESAAAAVVNKNTFDDLK
jgi:hypothetical protein